MKKKLLLIAFLAMGSGSEVFAGFFSNGSCCTPPPAYYRPGCCQKQRCCRERVKGKPRWTCCDKPKRWCLGRWLFGRKHCRRKKRCCWPNANKTCTPCKPQYENNCNNVTCQNVSCQQPIVEEIHETIVEN